MKEVIFGLIGASVVAIIIEVLLPNKEMKKHCIFALGVISAMIIISPLLSGISKLKGENFDYFNFKKESVTTSVRPKETRALELGLEEYLFQNGIKADVLAYIENGQVQYIGVTLEEVDKREKTVELIGESLKIPNWKINCYEKKGGG